MTDQAIANLERIDALVDMRRYPEAIASAQQLLAADPNNADAACVLARAELGAGNHEQALNAAQTAIALAPDEEWQHRLASVALSGLGQHERAVSEAREAVRLAPQQYGTHLRLGEALVAAGRTTEARVHAQQALELAPTVPSAHCLTGRIAYTEDRLDDAEESYRRALAIQPDHTDSLNELARIRLRKSARGFRGAAMADAASGFAAASRVDPRNQVIRRNLELVTISFLRRTAYLVFIAAWLGYASSGSSSSHSSNFRALPLILLALPAAYAARFVTRLQKPMRIFLLDVITRRPVILAAVTLQAVAIGCIVAGVLIPHHTPRALSVIAAVAAIGARVLIMIHRRRAKRAT